MANADQKRAVPAAVWLVLVILVGVAIFAVRTLTREKVQVRIAQVSYQTLRSTISTNGKVEPVEEFQAHAPVAGVIEKISVQVGQHVSVGTPLIRLDDSEALARMASANSSLSSAQLSLHDTDHGGNIEERNRYASDLSSTKTDRDQAQQELTVKQLLLQKGAASEGELAAARQRLQLAEATVQNAQQRAMGRYGAEDKTAATARVSDARASIAAARNSYAAVNIHSPISGTVYAIPVSEFDFVPAGDDLLDVADLNRIQVRAYFDEPDIGRLARGQFVKIVWDAKPGVEWHGHVDRAPSTVITYGTRNVGECIISVDDARGALLPNTNVTVTVTEKERLNALSVPREALHTSGGANFVYRIVGNKLLSTPVQIGVVNLTNVEITRGLSANDFIVLGPVTPGKDLSDGLTVKTKP